MPLTKDGHLYIGYEEQYLEEGEKELLIKFDKEMLSDFIEFLDKEQFDICLGDLTKKAIDKFLDERNN